jgi:hypothetical protein
MPYLDSEYPSILRGRDKRESQRLMAAAPALLDAIDQVCAALETCMAHYGDRMCEADRLSRYANLAAARNAQAKAEGYESWDAAVAARSSDEEGRE